MLSILRNDDTMCHLVDFFNKKGSQPYITLVSERYNNINILWSQAGLSNGLRYLKFGH